MPFTGAGPELEELMVEGFLLQVTLPETEQLYKYLLYKLAPMPIQKPNCRKSAEDDELQRTKHHKKVLA